MALTKTMIPLRARESFFRDEFFSDCWEIMERQKKEFEQKCASSLDSRDFSTNKLLSSLDRRTINDYHQQFSPISRRIRFHPASLMIMDTDHLTRKLSSGLGIHSDRDQFKVSLDVQQFAPEELSVKTCDSTIIIEGKHDEKEDYHGLISRHFQRKYTLPTDVKVEEVQCNFTADGRLHITAPRHVQVQTNGTTAADASDFEKMTYKKSTENPTSPSGYTSTPFGKYTLVSDKIREEVKQAKEDFEKSTAELLAARVERKDVFREEIKRAHDEFDKSTSGLFSRGTEHDEFRHSRLLRMFEPHFTAFPEFDPLPFWKRGKHSTLLEEFDKKSSLFDELANSGRLGKTTLLDQTSGLNSPSQEVQGDRENFKVMLDVHEFKPEELSVKTYDYFVEIEAKHEAKYDPHGNITRQFKRKYTLPRDVRAMDVQCNLSSEGILVVTAPRQKLEELAKNPHHVPIQQRDTITQVQSTNTNVTPQQGQNASHLYEPTTKTVNATTSLNEHAIPLDTAHREKVYQNVSTVHQIFTERKQVPLSNGDIRSTEHTIPITQAASTGTTSTTTTRPQVEIIGQGERVIPIGQESQSGGGRVEFPESRPESSASSIPFDFSRGKSEEPVSVASSVPPTFETTLAPGERIIKIQIAN